MRVKDQLPLDGDLWKDIKADESGWLIDQEANQRCIIITLIKRDARTLGNSFFSLFGCYGDTMMEHMFFFPGLDRGLLAFGPWGKWALACGYL